MYFVLTAAGVAETSGFLSQYCGWHTHATINGSDLKYAFIGDPTILNARRLAIADPGAKRVYITSGQESALEAFARGFVRGALGMGVADRVIMLEFSIYSVASPEAAASIVWRDNSRKVEAAEQLQITSREILAMGVVEEVGNAVRNFRPGDRVVVPSTIGCGNCSYCRAGYYSQCDHANPNGPASGTAFYGGPESSGPFQGMQAEFVRVPFANINLVKLPEEVIVPPPLTTLQVTVAGTVFPTRTADPPSAAETTSRAAASRDRRADSRPADRVRPRRVR